METAEAPARRCVEHLDDSSALGLISRGSDAQRELCRLEPIRTTQAD